MARLKFKPTPIARLRKMNAPIKMVGDPPWSGYGKHAWANRERAVYNYEIERKHWNMAWKPEVWERAHKENERLSMLLARMDFDYDAAYVDAAEYDYDQAVFDNDMWDYEHEHFIDAA